MKLQLINPDTTGAVNAKVGSFAATPAVESVGLSDALAMAIRG